MSNPNPNPEPKPTASKQPVAQPVTLKPGFKLQLSCACQRCALCDAAGATRFVTRALIAPIVLPAHVVQSQVALVCARHLPAGFDALPLRAKAQAVANVWTRIDERQGRLGVAVRIAPIRRPLPYQQLPQGAEWRLLRGVSRMTRALRGLLKLVRSRKEVTPME